MKKWLLSLAATAVIAVGCTQEPEVDTVGAVPEEIIVEILTPTETNANETLSLEAHVTQGGENVNDVDSVQFEIWESGLREEGQMLDGELTKDGVYKADVVLDRDGVYYMYAHTTARGLHVMPKHKIVVGHPDMSKVLEDNSTDSMNHFNEDASGEEEEEGHDQ
ncbi:FixH family protein [Lysinibacillus sp. 54212]|uniref:FixH family protein n=1 Tax=Lysinibacillus sp. 54212 TaxID=3119829 RepID=UPI002FCC32B8